MSRRVTLNPHVDDIPTLISTKHKKGFRIGSFKFGRSSMYRADRLFRHLGEKVARALHFARSSRKVYSANLPRSRSYAETIDAQRAEAMEDCIQFLNSCSSLKRSNSVACSC